MKVNYIFDILKRDYAFFSIKQWIGASVGFVCGILLLTDYSNNYLPIYIKIPVTILGGISMYLFFKPFENNYEVSK